MSDKDAIRDKVSDFLKSCDGKEEETPPEVTERDAWYPGINWPNEELIVNTPEQALPLSSVAAGTKN